ncbi:unnamed protein product, partial [Rotaria magnacalcarata]
MRKYRRLASIGLQHDDNVPFVDNDGHAPEHFVIRKRRVLLHF